MHASSELRHTHTHTFFIPFYQQILFMFLQLCMALDHIHGKKMLHRDIKGANIFLTSTGVIKLGDFGFSHEYEETVSNAVAGTFCGTPYYLAPEVCNAAQHTLCTRDRNTTHTAVGEQEVRKEGRRVVSRRAAVRDVCAEAAVHGAEHERYASNNSRSRA